MLLVTGVIVDWSSQASQAGCGKLVEKVSCRVAHPASEQLGRQWQSSEQRQRGAYVIAHSVQFQSVWAENRLSRLDVSWCE